LLKKKVAKNAAISLGYFIFSKNQNEFPKVAQLAKDCPSGPLLAASYLKTIKMSFQKWPNWKKLPILDTLY
jgi:hypothetical protein